MPTNQFKAWGTAVDANTLTYSSYSALTTLITKGFQPGVAESIQMNTVLRQVSSMTAAVGQFSTTYGALDAVDDGNVTNLVASIKSAIDAIVASSQYWKTGMLMTMMGLGSAVATPPGFIYLNGANVSRTGASAALWAALGSPNTGDGSTTFTLPDYRGYFLRGLDDGRGLDVDGAGRSLGSTQLSAVQLHQHMTAWGENGTGAFGRTNTGGRLGTQGSDYDNYWFKTNDGSDYDSTVNAAGVVSTETRPKNIAVQFFAKL